MNESLVNHAHSLYGNSLNERRPPVGIDRDFPQSTAANGIVPDGGSLGNQPTAILSMEVIAKALGFPELRGLLPCAAGFSWETLDDCRKLQAGLKPVTLVYCLSGWGWCEMEGYRHDLQEGKLLIISADTSFVCHAGAARDCRVVWLQIVGTDLDFFLNQLGAASKGQVLNLGGEPQLPALFEGLVQIVKTGHTPFHLVQAPGVLEKLLNTILQCRSERNTTREADRKIEQSIAYMKQHLDTPLHVGTLAALVSISPSHYFALFKRRTGSAPIDYFIRLRMRQACHLLNATSMSVKEVAATLGYEDPYYFSRMFKSVNEIAPSDYRAKHKAAKGQLGNPQNCAEAVAA